MSREGGPPRRPGNTPESLTAAPIPDFLRYLASVQLAVFWPVSREYSLLAGQENGGADVFRIVLHDLHLEKQLRPELWVDKSGRWDGLSGSLKGYFNTVQ